MRARLQLLLAGGIGEPVGEEALVSRWLASLTGGGEAGTNCAVERSTKGDVSEKAEAAVQSASAPAAYERRMAGCSNSMSGSRLMVVAWVSSATASSSASRESLMLALYYIIHIIIPRCMCTLAHTEAFHRWHFAAKTYSFGWIMESLKIRRYNSIGKSLEAGSHHYHLAQWRGQRSSRLTRCCQQCALGVADLQPRNFVHPARHPSVFANTPTSQSTSLPPIYFFPTPGKT